MCAVFSRTRFTKRRLRKGRGPYMPPMNWSTHYERVQRFWLVNQSVFFAVSLWITSGEDGERDAEGELRQITLSVC